MDDAQQIVLVGLEQAGVALPADLAGAHDVGPVALVAICSQAVSLIRGRGALGQTPDATLLPDSMAEKFRVCTDLAGEMKQLGYPTDLSFHQFLYPSQADTHRLLRFLLDKLSKSSTTGRSRGSRKGRGGLGRNRNREEDIDGSNIAATVRRSLSQWLVDYSKLALTEGRVGKREQLVPAGRGRSLLPESRKLLVPSVLELNVQNALKPACFDDSQFVVHASIHVDSEKLAHELRLGDEGLQGRSSSTAERHTGLGSSFVRAVRFSDGRHWTSPVPSHLVENTADVAGESSSLEGAHATEVDRGVTDQADASLLEQQLSGLSSQVLKIEEELRAVEQQTGKAKVEYEAAVEGAHLEEEKSLLLGRAVELALHGSAQPESSMRMLQSTLQENEKHLKALEAEWESVRMALQDERAELEKLWLSSKDQVQSSLKNMKEIRQEMKQISLKIVAREQEVAAMTSELKTLKGAARSTYVRRITELVRNSKKQDADIIRIINDTRELQRDSNAAQDRLRRSHALVDETVFRDAKTDPVCRQAYILLSSVHSNFADIVEKIYEMDKTGREVRELQVILEDLEKRSLDTASVQADLDAVIAENSALEKALA